VQGTIRKDEREPLFFGPDGDALFGCIHQPATGGVSRDLGVVLCAPFGQEYLRAHRSFVQLAARLASRGYPVLRFDFHGCGDSSGETEDGRLGRWIADAGTALDMLRERSGCSRLGLIGLRLGASVAALAGAARGDVDSLILWDPVIDGRGYLAELRGMHREMLRYEYVDPQLNLSEADSTEEVLGFALPPPLRSEIEQMDLLSLATAPAERVLMLETEGADSAEGLQGHLAALMTDLELRRSTTPRVWLTEPGKGIVPLKLIESMAAWLGEARP